MKESTPAIKFPSAVYAETVLEFNFRDSQRHFFSSLLEIHQAHALMLGRQRIITRAEMTTSNLVATSR
mgnify:CR=1 FL=1